MRWLCALLLSLWLATGAIAQTFVQKAINANLAGSTSLTTTFSAITSGNLLVGAAIWTPGGSCTNPTQNVKDGAGNAVTVIDTVFDSGNSLCLQTFYLANVTNGTTSLVLTMGATSAQLGLSMQEWSGIATSTPLDGHIGNVASSGTTVTSTAITTTVNGDLIFGAFGNDNNGDNISGANSPWTLRNNNTSVNLADESQVQGTAGSVSSTFNVTGGGGGGPIAVAAFKAAAGGGATCPMTRALMGVGC